MGRFHINKNKIRSVIELARYSVGDVAYWVTMRPTMIHDDENIDDDKKWMLDHHPKVLYERFKGGPYHKAWNRRTKLPKLHHEDFMVCMALLTSELVVEEFEIQSIVRSSNTAEFFYQNPNDEWMPESYLLDTMQAAKRELTRIQKIIRNWAK